MMLRAYLNKVNKYHGSRELLRRMRDISWTRRWEKEFKVLKSEWIAWLWKVKASGRILRRLWSRKRRRRLNASTRGCKEHLYQRKSLTRTRMAQWNNHHGRDLWRQVLRRQALEMLGQWFNKGLDGGLRSLKQWLVVHRALNGLRMWRRHHGRGGAERWDMSLLEEGWIVRVHSKSRKRRYHPLHSSVPVDARELQGLRVTKRFLVDRRMIITQDHWTGENRTEDNMGWSGYTFLKLNSTPSDDDGSYEVIDPEDWKPWAPVHKTRSVPRFWEITFPKRGSVFGEVTRMTRTWEVYQVQWHDILPTEGFSLRFKTVRCLSHHLSSIYTYTYDLLVSVNVYIYINNGLLHIQRVGSWFWNHPVGETTILSVDDWKRSEKKRKPSDLDKGEILGMSRFTLPKWCTTGT